MWQHESASPTLMRTLESRDRSGDGTTHPMRRVCRTLLCPRCSVNVVPIAPQSTARTSCCLHGRETVGERVNVSQGRRV